MPSYILLPKSAIVHEFDDEWEAMTELNGRTEKGEEGLAVYLVSCEVELDGWEKCPTCGRPFRKGSAGCWWKPCIENS